MQRVKRNSLLNQTTNVLPCMPITRVNRQLVSGVQCAISKRSIAKRCSTKLAVPKVKR